MDACKQYLYSCITRLNSISHNNSTSCQLFYSWLHCFSTLQLSLNHWDCNIQRCTGRAVYSAVLIVVIPLFPWQRNSTHAIGICIPVSLCPSHLGPPLDKNISAKFKGIHILMTSSLLKTKVHYYCTVVFLTWPMKVGRRMFISKATMKSNVSEYLIHDVNNTSHVNNRCFQALQAFQKCINCVFVFVLEICKKLENVFTSHLKKFYFITSVTDWKWFLPRVFSLRQ